MAERANTKASDHQTIWSRPVASLPLQKPLVLDEETSLQSCIEQMQERRIGCALILDRSETIVGIFTEKDVMVKYVGTPLSSQTPIKEVMTPNTLCVEPEATVSEAIDFFGEHHIRHLPICRQRRNLAGLLSIRVLTDYIAEHLPEDVLNLPPQEGIVSQESAGG